MYSFINSLFFSRENEFKSRYLPIQPDFERHQEDYKSIVVVRGNRLWKTVSEFYEISGSIYDDHCLHSIPDACVDMMFAFFDDCVKCYFLIGLTSLKNLYFHSANKIFGIRFMPCAGYSLLKNSINTILDVPIKFEDVFNCSDLCEKMYETLSFHSRVSLVSDFINKHIMSDFECKDLLNDCCDMIVESKGKLQIADISNATQFSDRFIRKKFNEIVGVSPKTLASIVKLQNVFYLSNYGSSSLTMTDISIIAGYTDLSHMNKELKKYIGLSSCQTKATDLKKIIATKNFEF